MSEIKPFRGKVVVVGFGQVARAFMELLDHHIIPFGGKVVIDRLPFADDFDRFACSGWIYRRESIVRKNISDVVARHVGPDDLMVNLTAGVCTIEMIESTLAVGALYVDTSIEPWEDQFDGLDWPPDQRGAYGFVVRLREAMEKARLNAKGPLPTSIVAMGANPGLVNHFAKAGLDELARRRDVEISQDLSPISRFGALAEALQIKTIHVSEQDSQYTNREKPKTVFRCTWSPEAFWSESLLPGEVGWGTHEPDLPPGSALYTYGTGRGVWFDKAARDIRLRSWAPQAGEFVGSAIPHVECLTLSEYLAARDGDGANIRYCPTVAFVYQAADEAEASMEESVARGGVLHAETQTMSDDIVSGMDELGVLLISTSGASLWVGSQLSIERTRSIIQHGNATVLQVAAGALGAALWAMSNPTQGYCEPEDLPHDFVLDIARPYIEPFVYAETDWPHRESWQDKDQDPAAFTSFLVDKFEEEMLLEKNRAFG